MFGTKKLKQEVAYLREELINLRREFDDQVAYEKKGYNVVMYTFREQEKKLEDIEKQVAQSRSGLLFRFEQHDKEIQELYAKIEKKDAVN